MYYYNNYDHLGRPNTITANPLPFGGEMLTETGISTSFNRMPPNPHVRTIALRAHNGAYVAAEGGGGGILVANRYQIGPWETFRLIRVPQGDGRYALQTSSGAYVAAENGGGGALVANRPGIGPWESFRLLPIYYQGQGTNKFAFQTSNGAYVSDDGGGNTPLVANRPAIGPWEIFTIEFL